MIERVKVKNYEVILDLERNEPKLFAVLRNNSVIITPTIEDKDLADVGRLLLDWFKLPYVSCSLELHLDSHKKLMQANVDSWNSLPFVLTHSFHDSNLNQRKVQVKGLKNILNYKGDSLNTVRLR